MTTPKDHTHAELLSFIPRFGSPEAAQKITPEIDELCRDHGLRHWVVAGIMLTPAAHNGNPAVSTALVVLSSDGTAPAVKAMLVRFGSTQVLSQIIEEECKLLPLEKMDAAAKLQKAQELAILDAVHLEATFRLLETMLDEPDPTDRPARLTGDSLEITNKVRALTEKAGFVVSLIAAAGLADSRHSGRKPGLGGIASGVGHAPAINLTAAGAIAGITAADAHRQGFTSNRFAEATERASNHAGMAILTTLSEREIDVLRSLATQYQSERN